MLNRFLAIGFLAIFVGCAPVQTSTVPETIPPADATKTPNRLPATTTVVPSSKTWWNDAVFYEIFVRSFYDSDGDGIGDFNGILAKLDYLNDGDPTTDSDLGVTGIWLMPVFPSPSYHGYDVTDYYLVNPEYGTLDDFKTLVAEAHQRGIRIIIDLVINHTSDQHPWFQAAREDIHSPYRDWYVWNETDPNYLGPWGQKVWHSSTTGFYYGLFEAFMPDLNYENPEVTAEMTKVYSFWLKDVGVDGFRLDAAKHLIESGREQQHTNATHEWYQSMYPIYKEMKPDALTVGELFGDNLNVASEYIQNKEFDLFFNFQLADAFIRSARLEKANITDYTIELSNKSIPDSQYAPFLTNHDQNRIMSQVWSNVGKAKVAASLLLTSPGTPFLYYGEEVGMEGTKPDEDIRKPMQWRADEHAGFTTGTPWRAPDPSFVNANVEAQNADPQSLLSHYRSLIHFRAEHSALRTGNYYAVDASAPDVYAALRKNDEEILLILINLSREPVSDVRLTSGDMALTDTTYTAETLFGIGEARPASVEQGNFQDYRPISRLDPYSTIIIRLQP
jgi:alpha-amylase